MVLQVPGLGAARVVNLAVGLEASGALAQLSQLNAQAGAIGVTFADAADNIGVVQGQLALLGFTAAGTAATMTSAFSEFEKQATLANVAAGNLGIGMQGVRERAQGLATDLAESPAEMADLVKQVEFFGLESDQASDRVARFSQILGQIGDTDAPLIAKNLARLINITRRSGETTEEAMERFDDLAASLFKVSTSITAPLPDLLNFIETFKVIGVQSNLTEQQITAIAGSVADLDDRMRALTTTAAQRIFLTEEFEAIAEEANNVRPELQATGETIKNMRAEEPVEFLRTIVQILTEAQEEQRLLEVMRELNVGTLRSARGLSALIANWEKAEELLVEVQDPQANVNDLMSAHDEIMATVNKRLELFTTRMENLMIDSGEFVTRALIPLIEKLGELAEMVRANEAALQAFTVATTVIPFGILIAGVSKLIGAMRPLAGLIGFLTGGRSAAAAIQGRQTFGSLIASEIGPGTKGLLGLGALGPALVPLARGAGAKPSQIRDFVANTLKQQGVNADRADELAQAIAKAEGDELVDVAGKATEAGFGRGQAEVLEETVSARQARQARFRNFLTRPFSALAGAGGIGEVPGAQARAQIRFGRVKRFENIIGSRLALARGVEAADIGDDARRFLQQEQALAEQLAARRAGELGTVRDPITGQFIGDVKAAQRASRAQRFGRTARRLPDVAKIPFIGDPIARRIAQSASPRPGLAKQLGRVGRFPGLFGGIAAAGLGILGGETADTVGAIGATTGIGTFAGRQLAARAGGAAIPVVGQIAAVLGILAPLFDKLAEKLREFGDDGGVMGTILNSLSVIAETLQLIGNLFNLGFDLATKAFETLFGLLEMMPVIGPAIEEVNNQVSNLSFNLNDLNESLEGARENINRSEVQFDGARPNLVVTQNIQSNETFDSLQSATMEEAKRALGEGST